MVASSYVLAATVISALVFFVGMPLGRRGCILMGDICVIVGSAIQASAMSMPHIIVGRVICGFGIGVSLKVSKPSSVLTFEKFISSTVPTYMAEMGIDKGQRGPEVAVQCAWLITGIAIAYWIDFGFTRTQSQISWVIMISQFFVRKEIADKNEALPYCISVYLRSNLFYTSLVSSRHTTLVLCPQQNRRGRCSLDAASR
jgi:MFS family permease